MRSPPEAAELVFFIDRCLGKGPVADTLRSRVAVRVHDDFFGNNCGDDEWVAQVARWGWIILTKDKRIRLRGGHRQALREHGAAVFVLTTGDATAAENAAAFLAALHRMHAFAAKYTRPLIATVTAKGVVKVIEGQRRAQVKR